MQWSMPPTLPGARPAPGHREPRPGTPPCRRRGMPPIEMHLHDYSYQCHVFDSVDFGCQDQWLASTKSLQVLAAVSSSCFSSSAMTACNRSLYFVMERARSNSSPCASAKIAFTLSANSEF